MNANAFEQNFEGNNDSTFAPTEKIRADPGDIIAEIERLEQLNAEFNQIEGLDNLFCHVNKCDDDMLDAMVAEFGLEFPDFDIFNYVDPALDALLDAGVADVLDRIDCEIRQPEFNLNKLAVEGSYDMPNRCGMGVDVPQTLEEPVGELQLLRNQLQQQQQLISELQEQIKSLKAIHMNLQQKQVEQVSTIEAHSKNDNNSMSLVPSQCHNGTSLSDAEESLQYGRLETIQERTKRRDERSVITQSQDVLEGEQQKPHLDETPCPLASEGNLKEFQSSLRKKRVAPLNRKRRGIHDGKRHVRNVPTGNSSLEESKTYSCKECNKCFNQKRNLSRHLLIHNGEKPHKCQLCNQCFSQKCHLTRHLLIHNGRKPHKCQLCNQCFSQKCHLTTHLLIHTGEKPFVCGVCDTSFRRKDTLTDHMNIHAGRKPHKCNVCNKSFRQRNSLSIHLKIHQN